jgi:hypothetical protein
MRGRDKRRGWKGDVLWFLLFLLLLQVGLAVVVDWSQPKLYDLEYGTRLELLQRQIRENPDRPLLVAVGSSRLVGGFQPERLPPLRTASGQVALPFNFSHLAAGPVMNLVEVRRLLRQGVRPKWLVLEIVPFCLAHENSMAVSQASAADLPVVQRYFDWVKVWSVYLRDRLNPLYHDRQEILVQCAPAWAGDAVLEERIKLNALGGDHDWWVKTTIDPEVKRRSVAAMRAAAAEELPHFHVTPAADRATRECLDLCRQEGVECVILTTPESSPLRSLYSEEGAEAVARYRAELSEEYNVPVVDASRWIPDEQFADAHHLLRAGADAFTDRLGREVLQPLVGGTLRRPWESRRAGR